MQPEHIMKIQYTYSKLSIYIYSTPKYNQVYILGALTDDEKHTHHAPIEHVDFPANTDK